MTNPWEVAPPAPPTMYTNGAEVVFSPWDFMIEFAHLAPVKSDEELTTVRLSSQRVVMSPQHMKAFLQVIADNVTKYEEQHGEIIRVPLESGGE